MRNVPQLAGSRYAADECDPRQQQFASIVSKVHGEKVWSFHVIFTRGALNSMASGRHLIFRHQFTSPKPLIQTQDIAG